jgi:agmatine deiminase
MITDDQTNFLYLSDKLLARPRFYSTLIEILKTSKINFDLLPFTNDIWCRDYMPIQASMNRFIQFVYQPSYLQNKKWIHTQTDPTLACDHIQIRPEESKLKLDGGNIIKGRTWAILTDKVFSENKHLTRKQIMTQLEEIFQVNIIIIPKEPNEMTGHADGIVRYYNSDTVLINQYKRTVSENFEIKLKRALKVGGLHAIEIPYSTAHSNTQSADGLYINFLQLKDFILLPIFEFDEDEKTIELFEQLYPNNKIKSINSREISKLGGILNCISWNIKI